MSALVGLPRRQLGNLTLGIRKLASRFVVPAGRAVWVDARVGSPLRESGSGVVFGGGEMHQGLIELLRTLEVAARDRRVTGVALRFEGSLGGFSAALALRRAVDELREAGKAVTAWGAVFSADAYLVACACDRVWLPVSGSLALVGLRSEQIYVRDLLDKWDVQPEVVQIGRFKNAGEALTRDSMSDEQREQVESWQRDVYQALVGGIARGRDLGEEAVRERIDTGPHTAQQALDLGLVDACLYPDELDAELRSLARERHGAWEEPHHVKAQTYYALHAASPGWQPLWTDLPGIAYVVVSGGIHQGSGRRGIASERLCRLLDGLRERDDVSGVLLRLDSPGGDAVASDLIHRCVSRLAEEKPVVASMGAVAASGGYYIAAGAHAIVAESATLTGSIGVVGGKVNLSGLYERLGIAKDGVELGSRAGLYSEVRGFTDDERDAVVRSLESVYELFLQRVSEGRGMSRDSVHEVAEGRIWSGARARELGLVDSLGGPLEALRELRRRIGLAGHEGFALELHPRRSPLVGLRELLQIATRVPV